MTLSSAAILHTFVFLLLLSFSAATSHSFTASPTSRRAICSTIFKNIDASSFVSALDPGWNLGNTLDAPEYEGAWNNPPVIAATFDDVKSAGFNGVRVPVTWHYHVQGASPNWTINSAWLQRVSDVVDMTTTRGLYTIVNMHHDSWIWADITKSQANISMIEEKFYKLWLQIGRKLACKSELLGFEPINEPPGTTPQHGAQINKFNELFLKAINEAGGHNARRVVTLVGAGEDDEKTSMWFKLPRGNFSNPIAIQYHYYAPYDFIFNAWGKTIWGSDADKSALERDISAVRGNFTNIPLVIGEWSASPSSTETSARWKYFDYFVRTAKKYNTATIVWDNGLDLLDRAMHRWRDETALSIYMNASRMFNNSLPDSTEDTSTSQNSSAYIYHWFGTDITDQSLPILLNGNILENILWNGRSLLVNSEFAFQPSSIMFKPALLSQIFNTTTGYGVKANLTVDFNEGVNFQVQAVEWDVPRINLSTARATRDSDLHIPIEWRGLAKLATAKAVKSDGSFLVDNWTRDLPPLQQGRMTYNTHFKWDESSVILTSDLMALVISGGQNTTITFEFFPRVLENRVNLTLTL